MRRLLALMMCAVSFGAAAQIETWSLSFNGPSSYSIAQLAAGNYVLQVSGTFCGGSCSGGHTTDAAYLLQNETAWGGRSFTVNEYCPQGWEGAGNCQFLRPTPDIFSPEHIYFYYIFHSGGQFTVYGLADECCWGDNLGGLDFALIQIEGGCTDSTACNFNFDAELDDGSCHFLCQYCKEGTVWDEVVQGCIVANPSDSNFDGCVQLNDLLDLLSAYGDCGAEESPWQCGDPLEHYGYDYETVQIGEQCWFAENCRYLPSVGTTNYTGGTAVVYDYNGYDEDEAMSTDEYMTYGVLYKHSAVESWDLCPQGWHIPSDIDWMGLETSLGMADNELDQFGFRGTGVGYELKSSTQWNGNNESGFNALAAGYQSFYLYGSVFYGSTEGLGSDAYYWTTDVGSSSGTALYRHLSSASTQIERGADNVGFNYSVRCIKDAE